VGYRVEGSIHNAQRNPAEAAAAFQNAFSREPSSALARQYAEALNQSGAAPKAVKVLESWIEKNPQDLESKSMLGLFLQQVGRPKEAIALYEGVVKQTPTRNPLLLNNLAWLLATSPNDAIRDAARAITLAEKACEATEWKEGHIISTLAAGHAEKGDFESAQKSVLSGEADAITSLFMSEARDARFDFTGTIFEGPASIFVRVERFDIGGLGSSGCCC
jgi:tetratricopeptide (TPR) repeat protein